VPLQPALFLSFVFNPRDLYYRGYKNDDDDAVFVSPASLSVDLFHISKLSPKPECPKFGIVGAGFSIVRRPFLVPMLC